MFCDPLVASLLHSELRGIREFFASQFIKAASSRFQKNSGRIFSSRFLRSFELRDRQSLIVKNVSSWAPSRIKNSRGFHLERSTTRAKLSSMPTLTSCHELRGIKPKWKNKTENRKDCCCKRRDFSFWNNSWNWILMSESSVQWKKYSKRRLKYSKTTYSVGLSLLLAEQQRATEKLCWSAIFPRCFLFSRTQKFSKFLCPKKRSFFRYRKRRNGEILKSLTM